MKVLGIDLGKKRIGVALGDLKNHLVVGLPTLLNNAKIWAELQQIIEREQITKLIIGLPRTMAGQQGQQANYTYKWGATANRHLGIEVEYIDERLSSKMARDGLAAIGQELTKENIDQAAAVLILQGYLDRQQT